MSDSDSNDDDDNLVALLASVDPQFNYNYQSKDHEKRITNELKSNRPAQCPDDHLSNELNTTPQFRKHVAKKLTEIIDRQIKITDKNPKAVIESEKQAENVGIRLFSTCNHFTTVDSEEMPPLRRPTKSGKRKTTNGETSSSDEDEAKLSSVAVSADWVIKGSAPYQILDTKSPTNTDLNCKTKTSKKKRKKTHKKSD